jgi:Cdc6-like AAA superfamily ATPase
MSEWFALKEGHSDFTIETDSDASLFFARHELDETIHRILRRSFRTGSPPKIVLYGDWGVGKTHTMRHVEFVIESNESFKATVVFVEMPDITSKSTFQVAHAALLDALGIDKAKQWMIQFQAKHPVDVSARIREFTQSGDISTAFANLMALGEGGRIAWDWLRGVAISAGDARLVGLPPTITQSNQFVRVLQMLGRLSQDVDGYLLVFMLDEATKLGSVTNQDAVDHWRNAFKLIADQQTKELGFIVSGSWVDPEDMALPLQDVQISSRFGESNYLMLQNLDEADTREFLVDLLSEWVDPILRASQMAQFASEADGEPLTDATYPFTTDGLELAVQYACRQGGISTPRDIQKTLDDLLNRAIDDSLHILSGAYVTSLVSG